MECKSCGAQIPDNSTQCPYCQAAVNRQAPPPPPTQSAPSYPPPVAQLGQKVPPSRVLVGICGIFLGALGIHKFLLGYNKAGVIMLVVTIITCGWGGFVMGLIGFVEGIIYLTKSDAEFTEIYVNNKKEWF
jgi:TM2 domain-containing membrane protein YozV